MDEPIDIIANDNADIKVAIQRRTFQIFEDARESGWTIDKEREVFAIASAWALLAGAPGRRETFPSSAVDIGIAPPRRKGEYAERDTDCEHAVGIAISELLKRAQLLGWRTRELLDAIESVTRHERVAYAQDPVSPMAD